MATLIEGCLQDLQRFLRRDDYETKSFHIQLGSWGILGKHLLPMLATYRESHEIVFEIIKLLVMLTLPAESKMRDPTNYIRKLQEHKDSFLHADILAIILGLSVVPLSRVGMERTKQDIELLELMLTLIRNLLAVPNPSLANSLHHFNLQDEFIHILDREKVLMLILHLSNHVEEIENRKFNLLLLEIVFLLFKSEEAQILPFEVWSFMKYEPTVISTSTSANRPILTESQMSQSLLASNSSLTNSADISGGNNTGNPLPSQIMSAKGAALSAALESLTKKKVNATPGRHSRFGGLVVSTPAVKAAVVPSAPLVAVVVGDDVEVVDEGPKKKEKIGVQYKSENQYLQRNSISSILRPELSVLKVPAKAGGRRTQPYIPPAPTSTSTKLILKNFADLFLEHGFNELMRTVRNDVTSSSKNLVDSDYDHYIWIIGFFSAYLTCNFDAKTEFYKLKKNEVVDEDMVLDARFIHSIFDDKSFLFILEQLERYEVEKDGVKMALIFKSLKQLLVALYGLHTSDQSENLRISETILMRLIYDPSLLVDRLPKLVKTFSFAKDSPKYLADLIEGIDIFLDLLTRIDATGSGRLVQMKKKSRHQTLGDDMASGMSSSEDEVDETLDDFIHDPMDEDDGKDAEGDQDDTKENSEAAKVKRIKAKDLLTEDSDDELDLDEPAFGAPKSKTNKVTSETNEEADQEQKETTMNPQEMDSQENIPVKVPRKKRKPVVESDNEEATAEGEKYFNLDDYVTFYSKQIILRAVLYLLRNYEINSTRTNLALLHCLERLERLGGIAMLFQVSYLRLFAGILNDPKLLLISKKKYQKNNVVEASNDLNKEYVLVLLREFAVRVIEGWIEAMERDPVTIGLNTLWPKKLGQARDLMDGTYLTIESVHDGTLEEYESRYKDVYLGEEEVDLPQTEKLRKRPIFGSVVEEDVDFDLSEMLASDEQRVEDVWRKLKVSEEKSGFWTKETDSQLLDLFEQYYELEGIDLIQTIISMFNSPSEVRLEAPQVYLRLETLITDSDKFNKVSKPKMELETGDNHTEATNGHKESAPAITARMARDAMLKKIIARLAKKTSTKTKKSWIADGDEESEEPLVLNEEEGEEGVSKEGGRKENARQRPKRNVSKKTVLDTLIDQFTDSDDDHVEGEVASRPAKKKGQDDDAFEPRKVDESTETSKRKKVKITASKKRKAADEPHISDEEEARAAVSSEFNVGSGDTAAAKDGTENEVVRPLKKRKLVKHSVVESDSDIELPTSPLVVNNTDDDLLLDLDDTPAIGGKSRLKRKPLIEDDEL